MSNWDFGYGREPAHPRDPQYPPPEGWAGRDSAPYDPQAAPYPLTYERDDFEGRQTWSTGPQQAGARRAAVRPTSPGQAVPPRPGSRQDRPWQTAPQRPASAQAAPWQAGPRSGASRPAPPPTDQFAGDQYMDGRPGYPGGQSGYLGGQRGGAPYEEPWLDDPRGQRIDGPWWDPDSWPGWRRWLIPVGVAVLAAAIGAALVLLTGMHTGASAG